jgi:small nuclear ribonucleoprotein (snRNP)-like protein
MVVTLKILDEIINKNYQIKTVDGARFSGIWISVDFSMICDLKEETLMTRFLPDSLARYNAASPERIRDSLFL